MHYEGVNLNAMEALRYRIARHFEHCIILHRFNAYRPEEVRSLQKSNIVSIKGKAPI